MEELYTVVLKQGANNKYQYLIKFKKPITRFKMNEIIAKAKIEANGTIDDILKELEKEYEFDSIPLHFYATFEF